MAEQKHSPNFDQPMKMQGADPNKVVCRDCAFRDKKTVTIDGRIIPTGITKSFCKIYEKPPKTNGKPLDVLLRNAECKYYHKDTE